LKLTHGQPTGATFISGDPVHERDLWRRWIGWIADHFEVEQ